MANACVELYSSLTTTFEQVIYVTINMIIIISATILNSIIIHIIRSNARFSESWLYLFGALACSDLLMVAVSETLYVAIVIFGPSKSCVPETLCCWMTGTFTGTTMLLLCLITRERYLCVKSNQRAYTGSANRKVHAALCLVASSIVSMTFIIETKYVLPFEAIEILSLLVLTCFTTIIVYYVRLRRVVKLHQIEMVRQRARLRVTTKIPIQTTNDLSLLNRSIFFLAASYALAYIPVTVLFLLQIVQHRVFKRTTSHLAPLFVWLSVCGYLNSIIDPLIYAFRCDPIGKEIRKTLRRMRSRLVTYDEDQMQRTVTFAMPRDAPNNNNDDSRNVAMIHSPEDQNKDNDGPVIHVKPQIFLSESLTEKQ